MVTGIMTLVSVILTFQVDQVIMFGASAGVAFSLAMAVGIALKSRICAILMFLFYVARRLFIVLQDPDPSAVWIVAILLAICLFQAIQGTFQYYRWKKEEAV